MARFDVYALKRGGALVVDCQADLLDGLKTRVVAPLIVESQAPKPARRLNPVFEIGGEHYVLMVQLLSAVELRELGAKVVSLEEDGDTVLNALDFLLTGV
ncbi:toxin CcdB [Erythromicrobium ramosum]|uniref:Toxin CcdB n=1 Tax=Erythrobacter ramosus TaxID=35811 RepID=A0A6I4UNN7_9SPHN|nr:CcdB family protein [Erythrobacter ramosus]MBB3775846.1 toxin CcdB [Erythrobacter ramosus]MXP39063.1 plasmid maintenance protein CcdB [Erythrobacter ramosus]